jgi:ABC-type Fe3+/spermidine/putrescine transport system ATPase subunit
MRKAFDHVIAVDDVTLNVGEGERLALLGPSGCGNTTTLNMVAGILEPDAGQVLIGGRDVSRVPDYKRNTGMVFQNYALFPHLTVGDNIGFGLEMRGINRSKRRDIILSALELVRLGGLGQRYPCELSGGQQQRVALARALAISPDVLLLDEPLSNLDAKLRREMRVEIVRILEQASTTTIFVTHDQEEAFALADRVAVMNRGCIEQVGSPEEIYARPATAFVAKFLGQPNTLPIEITGMNGGLTICRLADLTVVSQSAWIGGSAGELVLRTERLTLSPRPTGLTNDFRVPVQHCVFLGSDVHYTIELGGHPVTVAQKAGGEPIREEAYIGWPAEESLLFPAEGGKR